MPAAKFAQPHHSERSVRPWQYAVAMFSELLQLRYEPVSYTHLTLPTIYSV